MEDVPLPCSITRGWSEYHWLISSTWIEAVWNPDAAVVATAQLAIPSTIWIIPVESITVGHSQGSQQSRLQDEVGRRGLRRGLLRDPKVEAPPGRPGLAGAQCVPGERSAFEAAGGAQREAAPGLLGAKVRFGSVLEELKY